MQRECGRQRLFIWPMREHQWCPHGFRHARPEMAPAKVSATQVRWWIDPGRSQCQSIRNRADRNSRPGNRNYTHGHRTRRRWPPRTSAERSPRWGGGLGSMGSATTAPGVLQARGNMHIVAGRQWSRTRPTMRPERRSIPPALRPEKTSRSPVAGFGPTLCARNATSMTGACQGDDDRSHSPSMRLFSLS
jgi:hypothetical protein